MTDVAFCYVCMCVYSYSYLIPNISEWCMHGHVCHIHRMLYIIVKENKTIITREMRHYQQ